MAKTLLISPKTFIGESWDSIKLICRRAVLFEIENLKRFFTLSNQGVECIFVKKNSLSFFLVYIEGVHYFNACNCTIMYYVSYISGLYLKTCFKKLNILFHIFPDVDLNIFVQKHIYNSTCLITDLMVSDLLVRFYSKLISFTS